MLRHFPIVFVNAVWVGMRIQEEEETFSLLYVGLTWMLYFYLSEFAVCLITKVSVLKESKLRLEPCYCQCFILLYIVPEGPWNPSEMIYDNLRHLTIHLKKKTIFLPGFLSNLAVRRHHVFNLSTAVCWCVLTMLCVTDGVLCWKHPAVVLLTWRR